MDGAENGAEDGAGGGATPRKSYRIDAVARSLRVLECLGRRPGSGVTAIAQATGLTKTVVFRILRTLEEAGFVQREDEGATYHLGYRVAVLGERVGRKGALLHVAAPVLDRLRDATGENVNLVVREGMTAVAIATREGTHPIRLFAQSGRRGPLHAGGASQILLAHADPSIRDSVLAAPLERYTPHTVTDRAALEAKLDLIRRQGFNVALNDLDDGAFSVSAPISAPGRDGAEAVIAGVSVAGVSARLDEVHRAAYLDAVRGAAEEVSAKLRYAE